MRRFCLLISSLLLSPVMGLAGPYDVPNEPHAIRSQTIEAPQHLQIPPQKQSINKPPPEPDNSSVTEQHPIIVQEPSSLLAAQGSKSPAEAGFSDNVWEYMTQIEAVKLLKKLPAPVEPELLNKRIAELLQVKAPPPMQADDRWFSMRLYTLLRVGAPEAAASMVIHVPENLREHIDPVVTLQAALASGELKAACNSLQKYQKPKTMDPKQWELLSLYCQSALGHYPKVELKLALAKETGTPYPDWFIALVEHFQYPDTPLPNITPQHSHLERSMIAAASKADSATNEIKEFPDKLESAIPAVAYHIRQSDLSSTTKWLALMDRKAGRSVQNYVTHELVRLLEARPVAAQSKAAKTLPPFLGDENLSSDDIELLDRFYTIMQSFEYQLPKMTDVWIEKHRRPIEARQTTAIQTKLDRYARAGNRAGYLLTLPHVFNNGGLISLPNHLLGNVLFDLQQLGERTLAKNIGAESLLVLMEAN